MHDPQCVFCKIVQGQLPARKVYEDDELLAFDDIAPWAPVHVLLIPKRHLTSLAHADPQADAGLLGRMLALAPQIARERGADNGFRVVINTGPDGGQEVPHLHLHILGGPRPWSKG